MAILLHAGTLLAKPGEEPLRRQTVVVADGKVSEITVGYVNPSTDDILVDLSDAFVLPGLIDCHVHLTGQFGPQHKLVQVEESPSAVALHAAHYAHLTLEAGFTTVRDLGEIGGAGDAIFSLRNAVARGYVPGPRIFAAGSIISPTGGHGISCGYRDDVNLLLDSSGRGDGADGCRMAVRRQVSRGADFIKFVATGGVLTDTATGTGQQFFADEYEAIVGTAKMLGRKTTAHAHGADGMKAALLAGVDAIEHGTFMDGEVTELMLERGTFYVPTALAGTTVAEIAAKESYMPPAIRDKALEVGPQIVGTLARAHKAGIRIAFGTDTAVSPHGENAREFALMVKAGMTPMEAITAATVTAAEHIGQASALGTIEPGRVADIIATGSSPLDDVRALEAVSFVMRDGKVFKNRRGADASKR
ncbi:MAG: amidohydrolase family protein [Alphaproteobacteria bacterium]|nr:amidohydrolase family protein [Alphaproteobacteria bacterium]